MDHPSSPTASTSNNAEDAARAATLLLLTSLALAQQTTAAENSRSGEVSDVAVEVPDPGTPVSVSRVHSWVAAAQQGDPPSIGDYGSSAQRRDGPRSSALASGPQEAHLQSDLAGNDRIHSAENASHPSSPSNPNVRHITLPSPAYDRPLPTIPSTLARNGSRSPSTRAQRPSAHRVPSTRSIGNLSNDLGRMPVPRPFPVITSDVTRDLSPTDDVFTRTEPRPTRDRELRPGFYGDRASARAEADAREAEIQRRRSVRLDDHRDEGYDGSLSEGRRDPRRSRPSLIHRRSRQGTTQSRDGDPEAGPADDAGSTAVGTEPTKGTVRYLLERPLRTARRERIKAGSQARWTNYALNTAIGLQVLFGALTTGLGAALSGKSSSAPLAISILGGASTILASYLARARGSGEPENSALRVHKLEHFLRRLETFCDDHGDENGDDYKKDIGEFRNELEALLGNAEDTYAQNSAQQSRTLTQTQTVGKASPALPAPGRPTLDPSFHTLQQSPSHPMVNHSFAAQSVQPTVYSRAIQPPAAGTPGASAFTQQTMPPSVSFPQPIYQYSSIRDNNVGPGGTGVPGLPATGVLGVPTVSHPTQSPTIAQDPTIGLPHAVIQPPNTAPSLGLAQPHIATQPHFDFQPRYGVQPAGPGTDVYASGVSGAYSIAGGGMTPGYTSTNSYNTPAIAAPFAGPEAAAALYTPSQVSPHQVYGPQPSGFYDTLSAVAVNVTNAAVNQSLIDTQQSALSAQINTQYGQLEVSTGAPDINSGDAQVLVQVPDPQLGSQGNGTPSPPPDNHAYTVSLTVPHSD